MFALPRTQQMLCNLNPARAFVQSYSVSCDMTAWPAGKPCGTTTGLLSHMQSTKGT